MCWLTLRDVAEKTIDSLPHACREELQDSLEEPSASLSPTCRFEVRKVLEEGRPVVSALTLTIIVVTGVSSRCFVPAVFP